MYKSENQTLTNMAELEENRVTYESLYRASNGPIP